MEKIFKPFVIAALFCAALLSCLPTSAQNLPDGTYLTANGICYRKSATRVDGTNDQYIIDLETFVTGNVTVTHDIKPADIVLVLDISGSMSEYVWTKNPDEVEGSFSSTDLRDHFYKPEKTESVWSNYEGYAAETLYQVRHTDGNLYRLYTLRYTRDVYSSSGTSKHPGYFIYYKVGNVKYFIKPDKTVVRNPELMSKTGQNARWTVVAESLMQRDASSIIYSGTLYKDRTKLESLRLAANAFLDVVADKDPDNVDTGHRVALVTFSTGSSIKAQLTEVKDGIESLKQKIEDLTTFGETQIDSGMENAKNILDTVKSLDRSRFVIVFTDGAPTSSKDRAIGFAQTIKTTGENAINGIVYTIGMLPANEATEEVNQFMNYLSSNFPNAASMNSPGTGTMNGDYYIDAVNGDLTEIFGQVAEHTAGSAENTLVTGASTVTVDVISTSFSISTPLEEVQVLVAPCEGEWTATDGNTYLTFGEAKKATEYDLPAITLDDTAPEGTVRTTGFDYSANYCAYKANPEFKHGYKQIIRFRIKANEDAVGGPDVLTNEESSGIYINDPANPGQTKQIAVFNRPTVKVPVQIWIAKQGLLGSDNAVFTIYYADPKAAANVGKGVADYSWTHFTKVSINNDLPLKYDNGGTQIPMVKVVGLDPDYVYKIKEDAWGWSYTPVVGTMYTAPVKETDIISNPFIFINVPKENLKEDEDVVRNIFNPGSVTPSSGE